MDIGGPVNVTTGITTDQLMATGLSVKALVDALKNAFPARLQGGKVILLALGLSLAFSALLTVAVLVVYRDVVYGAVVLFLASLGIDVTGRWREGKLPGRGDQ